MGLPTLAKLQRLTEEKQALRDNSREALALLGLIDAEFRTDPMSVQCFDLSIVQRVRACVAKAEAL
jgi:hypothetical protein